MDTTDDMDTTDNEVSDVSMDLAKLFLSDKETESKDKRKRDDDDADELDLDKSDDTFDYLMHNSSQLRVSPMKKRRLH